MHSHIGCIFWIFLQGASSNVSSNNLPVRMQRGIVCNCWTFSTVYFQTSPQMPACEAAKSHWLHFFWLFSIVYPRMSLRRSIVTLIAFVWLFSTIVLVYFQMPPQISCLWGFKVIWLHLFDLVTLSVVSFRFFTFASFKPKSTKVFHMTPDNACMGRCIVAFVWLLLCCALMCPRSPYKRMQRCICLTFPAMFFEI